MFLPLLIFANPRIWLIIIAVIPAIVLMRYVYRSDRLDRESPKLLFSLVLMGIISTLIAYVIERVTDGFGSMAIQCLIIGLAEEGAKYLVLRYRTWREPEFNCQYDGVVYAVFVSLGFALWENISYVLSYGISTALLRAVTAVPGHACFGVFMGVWYGLAKRFDLAGDLKSRKTCLALCVILPALIHALYDYIAMTDVTEWVFIVFIAALFYVAFQIIKKASARDYVFYRR